MSVPVWYPITSSALQGPVLGPQRLSASAMKPSIFPWSMSLALAGSVCGPPMLLSLCNVRLDAGARHRVRDAHGGHAMVHRDPGRARVGPEVGVERPVLLHDHDHVLDLVNALRGGAAGPGRGRRGALLGGQVRAERQDG